MKLEDLLNIKGEEALITARDKVLTRSAFSGRVAELCDELGRTLKGDGGFILIRDEDPLSFYPLLFALWSSGAKVVFPTKGIMEAGEEYGFYSHSIRFEDNGLLITENSSYTFEVEGADVDTIAFSSGSTGTPKGILHKGENFLKNARSVNEYIGLEGYRSITPLKPYLVSALSHFLVHYMSGSHLIFIDVDDIDKVDEIYKYCGNASIVGSPMHVMMAASAVSSKRAPRFFFTSGDFIYASSIETILDKFPGSIFFKVYGLAEIAGRFFINRIDGSTPPTLYDIIGENIDGTSYEVIDGQIHVSSEFSFSGYVSGDKFHPALRPHPTGDLVVEQDGFLSLGGRTNDEIKVGGNKISLRHIEGKASALFKGDTVIMVSETHSLLGNLVCLVLKSSVKRTRGEIMALLKSTLDKHEMPHKYYLINDIPYTQSLKVDRKKITEELSSLTEIKR